MRRSLYILAIIFLDVFAFISFRQLLEVAMSEKSQSFNGSDKHVQVIARPRFVFRIILLL
jgi:hypothetical protein